ncbi:MAG: ribonuclease P protein component [Gammaproteobacteria bacterium]
MSVTRASVTRAHFPAHFRLRSADDFQRVFKTTRFKSGDRYLLILAIPNSLDYPRLGMAISIKNSGNAVNRNRLKRIVRETFRVNRESLEANDYVVLTRSGISALDNPSIAKALLTHWQTINKKCEN